jgi:hypothetical protein
VDVREGGRYNKSFFDKVKDPGELAAIGRTVSMQASLATSRRREQAKAAFQFSSGRCGGQRTSEIALARTEANVTRETIRRSSASPRLLRAAMDHAAAGAPEFVRQPGEC